MPPRTKSRRLPEASAPERTRLSCKRQFTAVIQRTDHWYIGFCPEVPGANGQGKTREACLEDLAAAVELMLEVNREQVMREVAPDAEETVLTVG